MKDRNSPQESVGEGEKKRKHGENTLDTTFVCHIFITNTNYNRMEQNSPLNMIPLKRTTPKKKQKTKGRFNHFYSFGCHLSTITDIQLQRFGQNPPCSTTFFRFFLVVISSTRPNTTKGGFITAQFHFNTRPVHWHPGPWWFRHTHVWH